MRGIAKYVKTLHGSIIITSPSGMDSDYVSITIEDTTSSLILAELKLSIEGFGKMLARSTNVPCEIEYHANPNIGKRLEVKTERVPLKLIPSNPDSFVPTLREAVKPFEVDGWVADIDRTRNHYRSIGDMYEVTFRRYVDVEEV